MTWHLLWCVEGGHFWKRERLPGTLPDSCWEHRVSALEGLQTMELWCEAGQHAWRHHRSRGKYPVSCPEHQADPAVSATGGPMRSRWVGDLRTCFLHDDGWAFRVEVNSYQLAGREGWRLPLTFAEHVGLDGWETRTLRPSRPELGDDVWIARRSRTCVGGPIDGPLKRLGAVPGDLAFFSAGVDRYEMTLRRQEELNDVTPMKRLLWSCGLDPADSEVLSEPWLRLARALGGSGGAGRDEVRRRLEHRGDDSLLGLLDEAGRSRSEHEDALRVPWPAGWQYRLPLADHTILPALEGTDQTVRVVLGVLDARNQPPRQLVLGDGGLLWLHQSLVADPEDLLEMLEPPHEA